MNKQEFLYWEKSSRDTIDLKKIYIDIAGDIVSGLLLSQIIFWNLPSNETGETKLRVEYEGNLWLAKGREDWFNECRITPKQFDRSIKVLEDKKIVKTIIKKFYGNPTKHIFLDIDELTRQIEIKMKETEGKNDIPQKVKREFTKGKEHSSPKDNKEVDHKVKSLTENTTEITTKTTSYKSKTDRFTDYPQRSYDGTDGGMTLKEVELLSRARSLNK